MHFEFARSVFLVSVVYLLFPGMVFASTFTGELQVEVQDNFKSKKSQTS